MMQAGVCLRRDTEATLTELTEQHRIRLKEEELSGLESVHMAESETECAAPGLDTLEPECVTPHSRVSDVHHTHTSLIKTETDVGSTHTGSFIKAENLDGTELRYVTHLHPDQIKTEADDGGFHNPEHIEDLQDFKPVNIKTESSEHLKSDLMNTGVDHKDQTGPCKYEGEPSPNCKKEEAHDLLTQCVTAHSGLKGELQKHASQIKTETDVCSAHTVDIIKTENLDLTELEYINRLHPDQIKTEPEDGGYLKAEHIGDFQYVKCDQMKCEASESFVSDVRSTLVCGAAVDHKHQPEPRQGVGSAALNHHLNVKNENDQITILHKSANSHKKHRDTPGKKGKVERVINSSKSPSLESVSQSKTICRNKGKINAGEMVFKCAECERCFTTKSYLSKHLRIHTREKPYKCTLCGKGFVKITYLNNHQVIHTGEKPFKCTHCGNCFSRISHLNYHLRMHTGEKPYKCTQCDKGFLRNSDLTVHLRIHTGAKPYVCNQCHKCFNSTFNLNIHLRIHTGEKPFKCLQCEKSFPTESYLTKHLRIHTGERPFKCAQCEKSFKTKSHLNNHAGIHTGEKPYNCSHCKKCFKTKSNLNSHQRVHTGGKVAV